MARVILYTTDYCPYCLLAKRLLDGKQVDYEVIDVTGDHERRAWLAERTGRRTVPQAFIDDRSVGGYDDLAALQRSGELDRLLGRGAD